MHQVHVHGFGNLNKSINMIVSNTNCAEITSLLTWQTKQAANQMPENLSITKYQNQGHNIFFFLTVKH